jgi:hypothetical protein
MSGMGHYVPCCSADYVLTQALVGAHNTSQRERRCFDFSSSLKVLSALRHVSARRTRSCSVRIVMNSNLNSDRTALFETTRYTPSSETYFKYSQETHCVLRAICFAFSSKSFGNGRLHADKDHITARQYKCDACFCRCTFLMLSSRWWPEVQVSVMITAAPERMVSQDRWWEVELNSNFKSE